MNNFYILNELDSTAGSGEKNLNAIREALKFAVSNGYDGLKLPFGEYEVYNSKALKNYGDMISGRLSPLDYKKFADNEVKNTAFELKGLENFIFSGDDTVLKFNGLIAPFDISFCKNVRLKRITVDWIDVPYFTADVISKNNNRIVILPHSSYNINGGEPVVSIQDIDMKTGAQGGMSLFENISSIKNEDGIYSFTCDEPDKVKVGKSLILRYIYNFAPAIHIYRSENITFEDITLKAAPGMGIIGQKVHNINLYRLTVKPSQGRVMSTNTDATHFINCSGTININTCYFEGMGDDATNVHGFYHIIRKIEGSRVYTEQTQTSQDGIDITFDAGHEIELVSSRTLKSYRNAKVLDSGFDSISGLYYVELSNKDAAAAVIGDCIASATEIASLNFENCVARNLRGRGILVQTRNVTVKCNLFEGCTGEGIHICTETGWWESISTKNIKISENRFINCGFGTTKYCDAVAVVVSTNAPEQTPGVHRDITINGNEIIGKNKPFLITCADGVRIFDNKIACENETVIQNSENIDIHDNKIIKYSDAFYIHPAVFAVRDNYLIMQPATENCLFSVDVDGEIFTDEINGIKRSSCPVHCVTVPQEKLDRAGEYTVITRRVIERTHNTPPCDRKTVSRKYKFYPVPDKNPRCYYIADSHGFTNLSINAAKVFGEIDFLILNGDIQCHSDEIKDFLLPLEVASELTGGEKPVLFLRGNHETIGQFAEIMNDYIPTDNQKTYFTARISKLWFLCLDCGCDHRDEFPEYSGTMACHEFREKQIDFIKSVIDNAKNEYDAPDVKNKIVLCHVPFTDHLTGKCPEEPEIYSKWQTLISENIKPDLMISGHMHEYSVHKNGNFPLIVASERHLDDFGGTGFVFSDSKITALFTSSTGEAKEKTIFKLT